MIAVRIAFTPSIYAAAYSTKTRPPQCLQRHQMTSRIPSATPYCSSWAFRHPPNRSREPCKIGAVPRYVGRASMRYLPFYTSSLNCFQDLHGLPYRVLGSGPWCLYSCGFGRNLEPLRSSKACGIRKLQRHNRVDFGIIRSICYNHFAITRDMQ